MSSATTKRLERQWVFAALLPLTLFLAPVTVTPAGSSGDRTGIALLKKSRAFFLIFVCLVLFFRPVTFRDQLAGATADEGRNRPNIVLVLADDIGVSGVSCYGSDTFDTPHIDRLGLETPNIDRLAAEGMMFTDAHSSSAVCTPTRYGLLTGRYNWRSRLKRGIVGKWERPLMKPERLTMAEMLNKRGYATKCIGKWHLGWHWPAKGGGTTSDPDRIDFGGRITGGPIDHGFDHYFGDDVPNWPPYAWRKDERLLGDITTRMEGGEMRGVSAGPAVDGWQFEAVLPELAERCAEYVRRGAEADAPFFLYFPMTSPHTPIAPSERFRGTTGVSSYADFLVETDWAVGRVLKALEKSGQAEETLVVFTADNGTSPKARFRYLEKQGVHLRNHWRGWKADAFEGGHRVPFVVRWPGRIEPGAKSAQLISLVDLMATFADVTGFELPPDAGEDSVSLLPVLRGEHEGGPLHEAVICHSLSGHFAVRQGPWKLMFCRGSGGWSPPRENLARKKGLPPLQLYHLTSDPKEQNNVAKEHPERVENIRSILRRYVENGRATPGPKQPNHKSRTSWPHLPWHGPSSGR